MCVCVLLGVLVHKCLRSDARVVGRTFAGQEQVAQCAIAGADGQFLGSFGKSCKGKLSIVISGSGFPRVTLQSWRNFARIRIAEKPAIDFLHSRRCCYVQNVGPWKSLRMNPTSRRVGRTHVS